MDIFEQLSLALAGRVAASAPLAVAIKAGPRHRSGILWRPDVVVTSEQVAGDESIRRAGRHVVLFPSRN